jgi:hypothetical protein
MIHCITKNSVLDRNKVVKISLEFGDLLEKWNQARRNIKKRKLILENYLRVTVIVLVAVLLPALLFAVSFAVYVPVFRYVCDIVFAVLVYPSPKLHLREVSFPMLVSAKVTVKGYLPEVGLAVKLAVRF